MLTAIVVAAITRQSHMLIGRGHQKLSSDQGSTMAVTINADYLRACAMRLRSLAETEPAPERAALINAMADAFAGEAEAMETGQRSGSDG